MNPDENIRMLEQTKAEVIRFTNDLDEKLARNEIDSIHYHIELNEKLGGKTKNEIISYLNQKINEESQKTNVKDEAEFKRKRTITISAAAITLIIMAIIGIIYTNPEALTGYTTATKQIENVLDYNRVFDHYTETQLDITNLTSLKISGTLEGTGAKIKLRINGTEYLIAQIKNPAQETSLITGMVVGEETPQYTLTTDKPGYGLGETATITITPTADNYSLYITYGEETHLLDTNTYTPATTGEYQIIALIVIPNDIIRLDTNFTVSEAKTETTTNETKTTTEPVTEPITTNETTTTNETNETTPTETTTETLTNAFVFENLCTETCNIAETQNPILIVEVDENATLTINTLTIVQTKENLAPEQTKNIPDITLAKGGSRTINLNNYFKDPEEETVQYDINEIPEITANINQNELTINSENPGTYTAYIYATDGNKMIVSNTFTITITETTEETTNETTPTNKTTNETVPTDETTNQTNETTTTTSEFTNCDDPNPNKRPPECMEGNEDKYFKDVSLYLQDLDTTIVARITSLGNMIIKGALIEYSTASPSPRDFRISYLAEDGETRITTAWIDSATGDLHLRGGLYEEQFKLLPSGADAFIIQNKKGTNLLYFERETGNLYLRGNLISERPQENIITE